MKAILGATLIDGTGQPPVENSAVLIDGDTIAMTGLIDDINVPPNSQVIDASRMTLMPGLIDCHDHLANFSYELASRWGLTEPKSLRHMRIAAVLKQTLETGYTTVRDAGGLDAGFKQAVQEGLIPGPRLKVALGFITPTGGMGDHTSPSGHTSLGSSDPSLPQGVADGPDAIRAKVREMVKAGADVIKTATTGGASSSLSLGPREKLFSKKELEALVDESHALDKRVMCHALGGPGLRLAVEVGVDSIEHGTYLDEDPDLLYMMAEKSIFFVPTFSVYGHHATRGTPHGKARASQLKNHHVRSLSLALAAGVKVAAGTDEGGWSHGNNAHEISCLVDAGMSPIQALTAATGHASQCIGLDTTIGTLTPGKVADLILVEGNPIDDVTILEHGKSVKLVMKDGNVFLDHHSP